MLSALILLGWCAAGPAPAAPAITVSAAISLSDVMEELGQAYARQDGGLVRFNFAGSNVLARQIAIGAPVDLFVSADGAQMSVVERAGRLVDRRVDLIGNRLAVVQAATAPAIRRIEDLAGPGFRRIALGDPAAVPAGVYARRYLEAVGLWARVSARVIPVGNVRAALAAVDTGSVDAAIVYATDVATASRARLAFVVTGVGAPVIVYPAAVTARTPERIEAARRFLRFLASEEASAILRRHGFEPLAAASRPPIGDHG